MSYLKSKPGSIEELARSMSPKLEADYQDKFKKELDKTGHKGIGTMSPKEKKAFFNKMDSMHKAKSEDHMADKKNAQRKLAKGEMKEGAMKGLLMDLEDEAAEMSLQAFLKKHKGGMHSDQTLKDIWRHVNESVNEDQEKNPANFQHLCAKQVTHESWGEGETVYSMHAEPDEEGNIEWYDVMFEHGIEKQVPITELKVLTQSSHNSHYKMKGKKKSLKSAHCSEFEPQGNQVNEATIEFDPTDFKQNRGPISNKDVADTVKDLQKKFPGIKGKKTGKYTIRFDHMGTSDTAKAGGFSVNKLALALDGMGFSLSDKERSRSLRGIRGEYEPDNVDETLDKIREANVAKQKSMREILADIWNMNEGKNPFEKTVKESPFDFKRQLKDPKKETMVMMTKGNYKGRTFVIDKKDLPKFERQGGVQVENKEEGFASDAQRRAAFAQGYKAKGKKGKKEEIEKSDKTMTGKKPTKVEIEPQVK